MIKKNLSEVLILKDFLWFIGLSCYSTNCFRFLQFRNKFFCFRMKGSSVLKVVELWCIFGDACSILIRLITATPKQNIAVKILKSSMNVLKLSLLCLIITNFGLKLTNSVSLVYFWYHIVFTILLNKKFCLKLVL